MRVSFNHPAPGTRHPAPGTRHPAPGTRHPAPGTRHPAPGTRHPAPGTRHPAPGTRHPAPGTRHPAPGTRTRHPAPGTRHPAPAPQIISSQFPSSKSQVPSSLGCPPLSYLDFRERSLRSLVLRSGNGTAMGNLENHQRLSASVYSSLPHPGANESVF